MFHIDGLVLHVIFPVMPGKNMAERHNAFLKRKYNSPYEDGIVKEVRAASARYEGANQFVGFNLPASFVEQTEPTLFSIVKSHGVKYVIAYMKGDYSSKKHEMRHAQYYLDPDYKHRVDTSWDMLKENNPRMYESIRKRFTESGYRENVFKDEFGAYYPNRVTPKRKSYQKRKSVNNKK